jgi:hypothetical protein
MMKEDKLMVLSRQVEPGMQHVMRAIHQDQSQGVDSRSIAS